MAQSSGRPRPLSTAEASATTSTCVLDGTGRRTTSRGLERLDVTKFAVGEIVHDHFASFTDARTGKIKITDYAATAR